MRYSSGGGLLGLLVLVVILVVVAPFIWLFARRRLRAALAVDRPFSYGEPMTPVPGTQRSFPVDVAGLPGIVSVNPFTSAVLRFRANPLLAAEQAWMAEPPGMIHLKVPLGPDWPSMSILFRAGGQQIGTALARSFGTAGTEVHTGNPAFDSAYRIASGAPDPRQVLAVVNPQVQAFVRTGLVMRWLSSHGMWLQVGYQHREQELAAIDWAVRLATLIVTSSGIPVVRPGPPPAGPAGQVPLSQA